MQQRQQQRASAVAADAADAVAGRERLPALLPRPRPPLHFSASLASVAAALARLAAAAASVRVELLACLALGWRLPMR